MTHKMHATGRRRKKIDKDVQNKNKKSTLKKITKKEFQTAFSLFV